MGSTWPPLTAQLEGEEGQGKERSGSSRSSGLNRRQVCVHMLMYPSMSTKRSPHTYKCIAGRKWRTLTKPLTEEKQGGESQTPKTGMAI